MFELIIIHERSHLRCKCCLFCTKNISYKHVFQIEISISKYGQAKYKGSKLEET